MNSYRQLIGYCLNLEAYSHSQT